MSSPAAAPVQDGQPRLEALAQFLEGVGRTSDMDILLQLTVQTLRATLGQIGVQYQTRHDEGWTSLSAVPDTATHAAMGDWHAALPSAGATFVELGEVSPAVWRVPEAGALYLYLAPDLNAESGLNSEIDRRPCGLLTVTLGTGRGWQDWERSIFRTVGHGLELACGRAAAQQAREAQRRELADQSAALTLFTAFTELAAAETDAVALSRKAYEVLDAHFAGHRGAYYELRQGLWKALTWTPALTPPQIGPITAGLPLDAPAFAQALNTRRPVFLDQEAQREHASVAGDCGAVCLLPLVVDQEVHGLFTVVLPAAGPWQRRDQQLLLALGRSLTLALERSEHVRRQLDQNAELQARTQALEAFEALSRELTLDVGAPELMRRAQGILMSMMPPGVCLYYELEGDTFHVKSQFGSMDNPALQRIVDGGLVFASTNNLRVPFESGRPCYQDRYDQKTDHLGAVAGTVGATATLPVRVGQQIRGVLALVIHHDHRTWSATDRTLLETMTRSLGLALDRAEQARQVNEERDALAAFTAFTESVGSETEVLTLIRQAITVLAETCDVDVTYSEREGGVFKLRLWPERYSPTLLAGYSPDIPHLAQAQHSRQCVFQDDWDGQANGFPSTAAYGAVALQPFFRGDLMTGVLLMASSRQRRWSERDRAVFRAVGRSLSLALDRAESVRQLARSNAELRVAVDELEAFAYSVSHDLRTPVRHIKGFNALLRGRLGPDAQTRMAASATGMDAKIEHYLGVIDTAAGRMNTLIDAMLDLSRTTRQPLRPEQVDLASLFTSVQTELTDDGADPAHLPDWRIGPLPTVPGDPHLLRQVVVNLLSNALKYTRTTAHPVIEVWAEERGAEWVVSVRDNGVGFDPRYASRLFGVFQRLHHEHEFEGTGVGLANVRRILTRHGGTVAAQGTLGEGATFTFTLPR